MATITLTKAQRERVLADADKQVEMLTAAELEEVASRLNTCMDIPFVSEKAEQVILVKIVKQIDRFLYKVLPNEIYELVKTSSDGLEDKDVDLIEERLAAIINKYVDIPFLSEQAEQKLFKFALSIIVGALRKGNKL